jgi:hypothetical protein
VLRTLKHLHGHVAGNGGEAVEEFFEAVIVFEIIEERLDRHPCSGEDGGAAENIWVGCDQVGRTHNEMLPDKLRDGEGGPGRSGISQGRRGDRSPDSAENTSILTPVRKPLPSLVRPRRRATRCRVRRRCDLILRQRCYSTPSGETS